MTHQDMIDNIKGNLGNRSSGRIGTESVDTVVLRALNLAVPHCVQEAQPDYYNRTAIINVVAGTRTYDLPILDEDEETIRIKDINAYRCLRVDNTEIIIRQVNHTEFVRSVPDYALEITGIPRLFALWGKANKLHLDYVPNEIFTLHLFVESYPTIITSANLLEPMEIDDQWHLIVEAFATSYCFLKMQQSKSYAIWLDLYQKQKASVSRTENEKHGKNQSMGLGVGHVSDPLLDPFIRSFN